MRFSISDFNCRMELKSPGYFVFYREDESNPVSELILKEAGEIPEVALVEIFENEMRGKGFGQAMYNEIEDHLNITLKASDNLSYDAYRFWVNRDPDQVKESLYAFRDQLIGKRINHSDAKGVISEVRHESVSVKENRMSLPLRKPHLQDLGLIPLPERSLNRFIDESVIKSEEGVPLRCFHGSKSDFDHFEDKPTYFTGNSGYQFIQNAEFVHECYISIKRPFWIEQQSDIESLKTFPEKLEALKRLGYDGIVYANPKDLKKGTSGWGDDYSQFIVFESSQIIHADVYPELENDIARKAQNTKNLDASNIIIENGSPKTFFHGTSSFFREFRDTKDIGYHFGTKRAAIERVGQTGLPEIDVELIEPSDTEVLCAKIQSGKIQAETTLDKAFHALMRTLMYPHSDIRSVLSEMPESEILGVIEESQGKEDSESFKRKAKNGLKDPKWVVKVDDDVVAEFVKKETAKKYAHEVKNSFIKRVNLIVKNPVRMEDLGVWCPFEIAEKAGLSEEFIKSNMDNVALSEDRFKILKDELKRQGYDGIVYENKVEDKGSESYIVFDHNQIIQLNPIEPDFRFETAPQTDCLSP